MADRPHVLIVGAGIIGASIAWHLARGGARVTLIEAGAPGGIATRHSWAWINASWGNPEPYFRLRHRSMALWRDLEQAIPDLRVSWSGGLIWDMPAAELEAYATQHAAWGYGVRRVDKAEAHRLEPALASPPDFALHVAEEGVVEPLAAAEALLRAAQDLGASLLAPQAVRAIEVVNSRVAGIDTDIGRIAADAVVIAAGTGSAALLATGGYTLPMSAPPGLLASTRPLPKLLNGLVMAPEMHVRQTAEGRLIAGADFGGSDPGQDAEAAARDLIAGLQRLLRVETALVPDFHTIGHRPLPADGFPAVGAVDKVSGLYAAVTHSGITLAPAIGRFLADEILTGQRHDLLAPYGPSRFA
jgi:glycine/D-amino acid oxidase-like deaminating enzyme